MKFLVLIISFGLALAAIDPETLSEEDLETITKFLEESQKEQIEKLESYVPSQIVEKRKPCYRDTECPNTQVCIDMPSVLFDVLKTQRALVAYDFIRQVTGVEQGECVNDFQEFLANNASAMVPVLESSVNQFNQFANRTKFEKEVTSLELFSDTQFEIINTPVARTASVGNMGGLGGLGDTNTLMMFLLFQSFSSGGSTGDSNLLTYMLLIPALSGGNLGAGGDMMSNPMFLFALMGDGGLGDSDGIMKIILLSSLFNSNDGFGSILPIVMLMGMGDNGGMEDMLPVLFMMNSFTGKGGNNPITDLIPLLLLTSQGGEGDNDFIKTFLIFSMISGGQSCAGNDILPLILLLTSQGEGEEGDTDMIFIIIMISMLGGGKGGLSEIFPFLLLNSDILGGGGGDGMDMGMLMIVLSLGNLGSGGIGSILPLLLLSDDSEMNMDELILITMLGQGNMGGKGGDVISLILPLLISGGMEEMGSMLPILLLLFSSGQSSNGCFKSVGATSEVSGLTHHTYQQKPHVVTTKPAFQEKGFDNFIFMIIVLMSLGGEGEGEGILEDPISILVFLLLAGSGGSVGGLLG